MRLSMKKEESEQKYTIQPNEHIKILLSLECFTEETMYCYDLLVSSITASKVAAAINSARQKYGINDIAVMLNRLDFADNPEIVLNTLCNALFTAGCLAACNLKDELLDVCRLIIEWGMRKHFYSFDDLITEDAMKDFVKTIVLNLVSKNAVEFAIAIDKAVESGDLEI